MLPACPPPNPKSKIPLPSYLPQRLIRRDPHARRQIQRPHFLVKPRNRHPRILPHFLPQPLRTPRRLPPEKQPIPIPKLHIPKTPARLRRKQPNTIRPRPARPKRLPVFMMMHIQRVPIIHPTPLQMPVRDREPQRMNQMQPAPRHRAKPPHISRILRNLRLK